MLLEDFLSSDAYTPVNKALAKSLWFVCAWFLGELIRQRKRFGGGEFYFSQADMEKEIGISAKVQRSCIWILVSKWFLIVEKKGNPCRNWYTLVDGAIFNGWDSGGATWCDQTAQLDVPEGHIYYKDNNNDTNNELKEFGGDDTTAKDFYSLWNCIPCKKWDEVVWLKEFQKKVSSGCAVRDMINVAMLDTFEIREEISNIMYAWLKENWIRKYCPQSEDLIESRIVAILRARYIRYLKWKKTRTNTVRELSDMFGSEYISWLWKQVQKDYKEQHW